MADPLFYPETVEISPEEMKEAERLDKARGTPYASAELYFLGKVVEDSHSDDVSVERVRSAIESLTGVAAEDWRYEDWFAEHGIQEHPPTEWAWAYDDYGGPARGPFATAEEAEASAAGSDPGDIHLGVVCRLLPEAFVDEDPEEVNALVEDIGFVAQEEEWGHISGTLTYLRTMEEGEEMRPEEDLKQVLCGWARRWVRSDAWVVSADARPMRITGEGTVVAR